MVLDGRNFTRMAKNVPAARCGASWLPQGSLPIRISLASLEDDIDWYCPACGHRGIVRKWRNVKWSRLKPSG